MGVQVEIVLKGPTPKMPASHYIYFTPAFMRPSFVKLELLFNNRPSGSTLLQGL